MTFYRIAWIDNKKHQKFFWDKKAACKQYYDLLNTFFDGDIDMVSLSENTALPDGTFDNKIIFYDI